MIASCTVQNRPSACLLHELSWTSFLAINKVVDTYHKPLRRFYYLWCEQKGRFDGLVIIARCEPHVPIPNTTVKTLCADGTLAQAMGE